MDTSLFKNYLISSGFSALTVKNYLADVNRFIRYFTSSYSLDFNPKLVTSKMIKDYQEVLKKDIGQRSVDRHLSSLRRYFQFLVAEGQIEKNPFSFEQAIPVTSLESLAKLKSFKDYLYKSKASDLTIKNYIIDVRQFLFWLSLSLNQSGEEIELPASEVIRRLSPDALQTYKQRLVSQSDLSVASINRKLSSLRAYLRWASANGVIDPSLVASGSEAIVFAHVSNVKLEDPLAGLYELNEDQPEATEPQTSSYSSFAPIRMMQKISIVLTLGLDFLIITPLADILTACQFLAWKASGEKLFVPTDKPEPGIYTRSSFANVQNLKRNSFSSRLLSPMEMAIHRKFAYYLIHVRPVWYRKYKSYKFVRGLHTVAMMTVVALAVMLFYNEFIVPDGNQRILGDRVENSGRTLSFKGSLADEKGNPIKDTSSLSFAIYTSATGAQNKLWQEKREVTPDPSGEFIVELGQGTKIPDYVFSQGKRLYIGVSVNNEAELLPRQPIPNVALAQDTQSVQGLVPITDPSAGSENVLLALDSSGNLTLGGSKSHTFQALGGAFQIKGQSIVLATLPGSSGSIVLSPDGAGIIDMQKPLQNTSNETIGPGPIGAVLVNDSLAINATGTNNEPALFISHEGFGPLITASSSGQVRFSVDDIGSTTIGHNLTIGGTDIASTRSVFNLLNRNVAIINFAGESEAVTIGSSSGTTTIRNARTMLSGDLTVLGQTGVSLLGNNAGINFSGPGNHVLTATSGNLILGTSLSLAENANIIPSTTNGTNTLGNNSNPFDTVYAENFVIPSKATLGQNSFGFGTTAPGYQFHVQLGNSSEAIAMFENTDSSLNADVLKLKVGSMSPGNDNKFINFLDGSNNSLGSIQASSSGGVSYLTTGSDFAEYFPKEKPSETMVTGDLVCLGKSGRATLCDSGSNDILGVITDRAGFVGASDKANNPNYVLVGLHGQVKVRVKAGERILPGDSLSVSSLKGIATRSVGPGRVLGRAMTPSDGQTMVQAYILPSWHDPGQSLGKSGNLAIMPVVSETEDSDSFLIIDSITNEAVGSIGVFSDALAASLKTGAVETKRLVSDNIFALNVKAQNIQADNIVAPVVESELIKVSILSPVTDDSLTIHLRNKRIDFISKEAESPVASLDDKGNASFSGSLSAATVNTQNLTARDASVEGTLRAKEIITENLNLSDQAFERLVEKIGTDYAEKLALLIKDGAKSQEVEQIVSPLLAEEDLPTSGPLASSLVLPDVNTNASASSTLPSIAGADLNIDKLNVNASLMVFGVTSMQQAAVADLLTVGASMTLQGNAINTLGTDLEIQPLKQGNISLMAGLIKIDTSGNANFTQNLTVQKTLFAREIKPVEKDLNVRLEDDKRFNVGGSDESVSINSKGDITSSGSGSFLDLLTNNFKVVRGAQADTSSTETTSSSSAGVATITRGQIERTIVSPFVTADSLIYLTPASETNGTTPYIARQTPQVAPSKKQPAGKMGSFTIRIQEKSDEEIKVNWWIIN